MCKAVDDPFKFKNVIVSQFLNTIRDIRNFFFRKPILPSFYRIDNYAKHINGPINGRALLLYVTFPFLNENGERASFKRVVGVRSLEIAKLLNQLGYVVDVVDWQDPIGMSRMDYNILLGMGPYYERAVNKLPLATCIYLATGAHSEYENTRESARANYLEKRRNTFITPRGMQTNNHSEISDAVISIGSRYINDTWDAFSKKLYGINSFAAIPIASNNNKVKYAASGNFLWFGSVYQIIRGLDLVLEAFAENPDLHLWVCTPIANVKDREFYKEYRQELFYTSNIHTVGWVELNSVLYYKIANQCRFVINASCTEGQSGGLLNCMANGLIPIATLSSGVDIKEVGFTIKEETIEGISSLLKEVSTLSDNALDEMSNNCKDVIKNIYSLDAFNCSLKKIILEILDSADEV